MPPPTYAHRHLLLTHLLADQPEPSPSAFAVGRPEDDADALGRRLDALLLSGWAKGKGVDKDVVSHADNLRLKAADFDVLGRLGEGQFGVVDAVRSRLDGEVYAMKTVQKTTALRAGEQLGLRYERHIHRLAGPSTPLPAFVTTFQSPDALYIITAYAPCGSLWDRMTDPARGAGTGEGSGKGAGVVPMDEDEVAWWGVQMVGAIAHVHKLGFAHRDIKPHNFLLAAPARVLLTDFGSAAPLTDARVPLALCALPAGTPDYVSPEVLAHAEAALVAAHHCDRSARSHGDDPHIDSADASLGYGRETDFWSLGACLYEMITGTTPFWARTIGATYDRIVRCDVKVPEVSAPLRSLLSSLLSPADVRLGRGGSHEVHAHAFFRALAHADPARPPASLALPQPIDLSTLAPAFDDDGDDGSFDAENSYGGPILGGMDEMTFDHFFASSPGVSASTLSTMRSSVRSDPAGIPARWVGWTVLPLPDFFGAAPPPSPVTSTALAPDAASSPFTPARPHAQFPAPRTAPRTVNRARPMTESRAFAELVACVRASARKKIREKGATPVGAGASADRERDRMHEPRGLAPAVRYPRLGGDREPPTPTPGSREQSRLVQLGTLEARRRTSGQGMGARGAGQVVTRTDRLAAEGAASSAGQLETLQRWNEEQEKGIEALQGRLEGIRRRLADAL
ncbi:hypothetical protein Q5752_000804 [Cryptotrichosporon argae]